MLLDVNVVVAAHRDDHSLHEVARHWLEARIADEAPFSVPSVVWGAFVRVSTNRRVFPIPTPLADAFAFARAVREQPGFRHVEPGDRHFSIFERLCETGNANGDLAYDAYLAAIAVEHGATWVSFDRDFARFPDLRWIVPGAPE